MREATPASRRGACGCNDAWPRQYGLDAPSRLPMLARSRQRLPLKSVLPTPLRVTRTPKRAVPPTARSRVPRSLAADHCADGTKVMPCAVYRFCHVAPPSELHTTRIATSTPDAAVPEKVASR